MNKIAEKLKAIKYFMKTETKVNPAAPQKNFWCFCCEKDIDNSKNQFMW
jgi:hypothetical protein